ncbi:DUF2637 domain-containing protein [Nocardiopsis sp. FIRDI 009]|uniref:DUF2637 domain-containing protein n=1 Tax=Nocardiopsis sp. FIRDI 009 TaxID=714197 RepID=UPI000E234B1D|nr:DUF2637 domain-containing protein [Nocardiopsis sp. FIRDI 009]
MLTVIAAVVSYSHMYELGLRNGEPEWRAALFPLSVDGMIVGASMTLLSDARHGRKGGVLPWTLLIVGSGASLAANVAVADPSMWSRIIHAWPSFALIGAYELLMREFRAVAKSVRSAFAADEQPTSDALEGETVESPSDSDAVPSEDAVSGAQSRTYLRVVEPSDKSQGVTVPPVQIEAWRWALDNRSDSGELPSGREIAERFGRKDRWGRLIKQKGQRGDLGGGAPALVERSPVVVG